MDLRDNDAATINYTTTEVGASTSTTIVNTTSTTTKSSLVNETTPMTTWLTTLETNMTDCPDGLEWIRDHFGDCIESTTQLFAFSCAIVGVSLWIIGHFFLLKSHRNNPDISCYRLCFLFISGLGSVCNLVGTTLCDQLGTQVLTACYLVFSEVVLLFQWIYWWNRNRKLNKQGLSFYVSSDGWKSPDKSRDENTMNGGGNVVLCLVCPLLMTACYLPIRFSIIPLPWQPSDPVHISGRKLLMVSDSTTDNFGYAMGFAALSLYASCQIPTIVNIVRHKMSYTVSLWHHSLVIAANILYFISIISYNTDPVFLTNALPWLLISLFFIFFSSVIIIVVLRNRGIGSHTRPVGRRRPDGTFLLYPSEESLNSDLERTGTLRFTDEAGKLPSIQEEPHLENNEQQEAENRDDYVDVDLNDDYDAETASIHSRASDFIMDDEEDVFDRDQEKRRSIAKQRKATDFDDDGLEWDFDDFRPKYTGSADDLEGSILDKNPSSPNHLHSLGVPHDHSDDLEDDGEWDEERVLGEIERELQMGDDMDGDTISMEYDTADDDGEHFDDMQYSYVSNS
ncbi:uncharacterized protein LOC129276783 [Lytechinus pictus]|uniref:uncharacterized protein LOC129276783 n=1 Tax=Lytechinus pictus TaxID=7653 RepID=UPI0030B9C7AA